jgi:hypothetical protein
MDFLDPRKKRAHKIRLFVGYFLMAIVIGLSSYLLFNIAYGFGYNTKTGQIIQNGLLFVDSKPGGADIYLNGKKQSATTTARLILPAGNYNLSITKNGYRSWTRSFVLEEHTVARYVYPFLFPTKPITIPLKSYPIQPAIVTQSPDRRWLLVQSEDSAQGNLVFHEYDTSNLAQAPVSITVPKSIITAADGSVFKAVEWSTNNNQLLLLHTFAGASEYIVIDRTKPETSFNVNKLFNIDPAQVALKNKRADQLYILDKDSGNLQVADVGQAALAPAILKHVLAFKPYGNSIINYVTDTGAPAGKVVARIWDNGDNYLLYTFAAGDKYLIDEAQFQGHWYYAAGSNTNERIDIFKDPEDYIRNPQYGKAVPLVALTETGATNLSFSDNTRFIAAQSGQNFAVYDLENQDSYRYTVKSPVEGDLNWMDGHRFIAQSAGHILVFDYDNKNQVLLGPTTLQQAAFFSTDYNQMITVVPGDNSATVTLQRVDLRAGSDLPANHAQ